MPQNQHHFPNIKLADLNGKNGFIIEGEIAEGFEGARAGSTVNKLGDFNQDGYDDLFIGAPIGSNRGYVVLGGPNVGNNGFLSLKNLNSTDGFKIMPDLSEQTCTYLTYAGGSNIDFNKDGTPDLVIGAFSCTVDNLGSAGRSYVIFGGNNIGVNGNFELSSLNGTNGFRIDGEHENDESGYAVGGIHDVNKDGYDDIIIAAPNASPQNRTAAGRNYVIFGTNKSIGNLGLLKLTDLNGVNGFKIDADEWTGTMMVGANGADINGDGYADLFISKGPVVVVFGAQNIGESGLFDLRNLNGANGFKSNENIDARNSMSGGEDFNQDGYLDLIIGSPGLSYVVYGAPQLGSTGLLSLTDLNGINGFKICGEVASLSGHKRIADWAGDINADGYPDILIGFPLDKGHSYIIFGGPGGLDNSGIFNLTSLDGMNGFILEGALSGEGSGNEVSPAGDINHDGVDDFVLGAPNSSPDEQENIGRAYVIFGDAPPIITHNNLHLYVGGSVLLNSTFLSAYDINHNNNTIIFTAEVSSAGHFEKINSRGIPITNFTQQEISDGTIQFVHDSNLQIPSYNITVYSDGIAWTGPDVADINLSYKFIISNNQFVISRGQSLVLTTANLAATEQGKTQLLNNLTFSLMAEPKHGYFARRSNPSSSISNFQVEDIMEQNIQFVHDGSLFTPAYQIMVFDSQSNLISSVQNGETLLIVKNKFEINQGEQFVVTANALNITSSINNADQILFTATIVENGHFALVEKPQAAILDFSQQQINDGKIIFSPDTTEKPNCYLTVNSGKATGIFNCLIDFDTPPVLQHAQFSIKPEDTIKITDVNLKATSDYSTEAELIFEVSNQVNGHFSYLASDYKMSLANFTQQEINDGEIVFISTAKTAPEFKISVWDGRMSCVSCPQDVNVGFDSNQQSDASDNSSLITASVGSGLGLGLIGLLIGYYVCQSRQHHKEAIIQASQNYDGRHKKYFLLIAEQIFNDIKFSNCLGYINERATQNYINAMGVLIQAFDDNQVDLNELSLEEDTVARKDLLKNISTQTRRQLNLDNKSCCSLRNCMTLFSGEVSRVRIQEITIHANAIAQGVKRSELARDQQLEIHEPQTVIPVEGDLKTPLLGGR